MINTVFDDNQGTKVTRGFSESSSSVSHEVEPCSPEMEGTIALFAPELPEDTLLEVRGFEFLSAPPS